jgi:hypothetical protein
MRVPPEVVEHLLGAGEGPLGVHHPWRGAELGHEGGETPRVGERRGATPDLHHGLLGLPGSDSAKTRFSLRFGLSLWRRGFAPRAHR